MELGHALPHDIEADAAPRELIRVAPCGEAGGKECLERRRVDAHPARALCHGVDVDAASVVAHGDLQLAVSLLCRDREHTGGWLPLGGSLRWWLDSVGHGAACEMQQNLTKGTLTVAVRSPAASRSMSSP